MGRLSRRAFLAGVASTAAWWPWRGAAGASLSRLSGAGRLGRQLGFPDPARLWHGDSSVAAWARQAGQVPGVSTVRRPREAPHEALPREPLPRESLAAEPLSSRYADLRRHFIFEYYPWYATEPWLHWNEAGREPPVDIAASSMPLLGPYDSRSRHVLEQHARWIADAGIGAVNVSWWGPGSFTDEVVPTLLDVMRDHDLRVTFHLEPYRNDRAELFADDVLWLVRKYGDARHWDAMLVLQDATGRAGPVFKLFRAILPPRVTDCLGREHEVPDYTEDARWRRQTARIRTELRGAFDHVTLLADSLDVGRTAASGFDGMAIYDNFVAPSTWPGHASVFSGGRLLFSFNVNAGFDAIVPRPTPDDPCWQPAPFDPGRMTLDWAVDRTRELAMELAGRRIAESFDTTVSLQSDPRLSNARRGFFLVYVNSFNEWHEGTQFEPAKDARDLTPAEWRVGYHNPPAGDYRLHLLGRLVRGLAG